MKTQRTIAMLLAAGLVLVAMGTAQGGVLVNFGDTPYTSDGSNTWQTFNLENGSGQFAPVAPTALADTTGAASGISLGVTGVIVQNLPTGPWNGVSNNVGATQAQFDAPASGTKPSWFDSSSAEQRETFGFFDYDVTYTLSGFSASDTVQLDFALGAGGMGAGDRALTLSYPAGPTTLFNDVQVNDVGRYATISGLTGSTSYSFLAESTGYTSGALVNALGVTTGPPPPPASVTTSATAPTDNVAIQQTTSNGNAPWRFDRPAGTDNNPRDAGQTFLVGPGGLVLDKITVRIDTLNTSNYDGESFTLGLYEFTNALDVVPDPDKGSPIFTETFDLPASLKSDFDGGADYLTIDLTDQTLTAGQYGFLLMFDANEASGSNMLLAVQTDGTSYADGIAIRRLNRGTGSDAFSAQTFWTGSADNDLDMEFYLQEAPAGDIPEPVTMAMLGLAVAGLGGYVRRRRRA